MDLAENVESVRGELGAATQDLAAAVAEVGCCILQPVLQAPDLSA